MASQSALIDVPLSQTVQVRPRVGPALSHQLNLLFHCLDPSVGYLPRVVKPSLLEQKREKKENKYLRQKATTPSSASGSCGQARDMGLQQHPPNLPAGPAIAQFVQQPSRRRRIIQSQPCLRAKSNLRIQSQNIRTATAAQATTCSIIHLTMLGSATAAEFSTSSAVLHTPPKQSGLHELQSQPLTRRSTSKATRLPV